MSIHNQRATRSKVSLVATWDAQAVAGPQQVIAQVVARLERADIDLVAARETPQAFSRLHHVREGGLRRGRLW